MDGLALLGIFLILYSVAVVWIAAKKPEKIWNMAKIRLFRKLLGEQGTVIFFYVFAVIAAAVGVWLMAK
ncbi:hypothetical protein [Acidaminobacter sp.]|uniref:hypothetical protein n=1 Tax=Acidaminobacter sp. TaxID=1872102 RepID=UPI00137C65F0|nr:hypothetical protein [Acidaminobacter sp.]MDK9710180.1 hypothetical protein [Acidaminobacter sp.]MZQ98734.1 hypothetical protein [Acidaminobacter sp.]